MPESVAGKVSVTDAPATLLGPVFETIIVYVSGVPGMAVDWPSVLVICRSACGVSVSVSVALLLPGVGSVTPAGAVTVAVLLKVPVAAGSIVADTTYVMELPGGIVTESLMFPLPLAVKPLAPPL